MSKRASSQKSPVVPIARRNNEYFPEHMPYHLVPILGSDEEMLVYHIGAEKHGAESWRNGMPWSTAVIKMNRHLGKFLSGESRCPKDGQHHLASVKFWCNSLMEWEQTCPEKDDIRG